MRRNIGWWLAGVTGLLLGIAPVLFVFLQWFHPDPEVFYHFLNHRLALTSQNTLFLMSLVAALSAVWGLLSAFLLHYYPPLK